VIGAGLIGCEFSNDLLNGGFSVEAVDPMDYCLPTLLPETAGRAVQRALEEKGATFHFGPLATDVNRTQTGYSVALNNGHTIEADAVLSAVGVRPRTQLAADAGIDCGRGIKTDRYLRTNINNVYAIGDCAEVEGHVLVYVAPLMAAARALAATLTGTPTEVVYPAMPVTIKTPACPVCVSPVPKDAAGEWTIEGDAPDIKALFHNPEGELLGFALTGQAVKERMPLAKQLPAILQ
jgi:rubredoxin-NAD+ reductase